MKSGMNYSETVEEDKRTLDAIAESREMAMRQAAHRNALQQLAELNHKEFPARYLRALGTPEYRAYTQALLKQIYRRCGATVGCKNTASEIHHIPPYSHGVFAPQFKVIGICRPCHNLLHNGKWSGGGWEPGANDNQRVEEAAEKRGRQMTLELDVRPAVANDDMPIKPVAANDDVYPEAPDNAGWWRPGPYG
jgi:hypothetical protein